MSTSPATGSDHHAHGGPLKSLRDHLRQWASMSHAEAIDLQKQAEKVGDLRIADAPDREQVTVAGTIRTVMLRPRGGVPALEAELSDGTATLTLLWLGRRRISGIFPGRAIEVSGRIGVHDGLRTMYNPRYELRC